MPILLFFVGLWLGGIIGVVAMCLFQISGKSAENESPDPSLKSSEGGILNKKSYNDSEGRILHSRQGRRSRAIQIYGIDARELSEFHIRRVRRRVYDDRRCRCKTSIIPGEKIL